MSKSKKPQSSSTKDNRKVWKQARTESNRAKRVAKAERDAKKDKLYAVERGTARAIRRWEQSITKQENPCQIKGIKWNPYKRGRRPEKQRKGQETVLLNGQEMSGMQAAIQAARLQAERMAERKAAGLAS